MGFRVTCLSSICLVDSSPSIVGWPGHGLCLDQHVWEEVLQLSSSVYAGLRGLAREVCMRRGVLVDLAKP